uniref:Uncharacterized protein n=1 Tax=Romanomermis culicivorax TaxID=13658 RepID=A0A915KWH9_ROMCU
MTDVPVGVSTNAALHRSCDNFNNLKIVEKSNHQGVCIKKEKFIESSQRAFGNSEHKFGCNRCIDHLKMNEAYVIASVENPTQSSCLDENPNPSQVV